MDMKKNISLIVGISIPIVMIVLVATFIYLPGFFAPAPKHNFLYISNGDYWQMKSYDVQGQKIDIREINPPPKYVPSGNVHFYIHDVKTDSDREITFEESQKLRLSDLPKSPDGYEVSHGARSGGGFFPFDYSRSYNNSFYLMGHSTSKKIHLSAVSSESYYSSESFKFIGWLL
jgi:hypothetical protein